MKKNISINLQGIIFHIEDDGYELLSRYLYEVKAHFASYQGHEEIVADIEGRIAELFSARVSASKQVITLADVEEMTAKMGRVSDFQADDDQEDEPAATTAAAGGAAGPRPATAPPLEADGQPRRLYRDLAHRKIAGVCAGIAQYFAVNPLLIRLAFLAPILVKPLLKALTLGHVHIDGTGELASISFIAYVVLWIALPKRDDAPTPVDTLSNSGPLAGRKLFRDIDTGQVGGVASGLAAYFRTDVVFVRVLFLLALFLGLSGGLIYLILWAVVPEARSVSEKMQMRGDAVTLSGIDSNLRTSALDAEGGAATGSRSLGTFLEGAARSAQPAVSFIGTLIRWTVAGLLFFAAGSLLVGLLIALGALLGTLPADSVEMWTPQTRSLLMSNLPGWGAVAGFLFLAVPLVALLLLALRLLLRRPVLGRTASLSLLGIWLLSLVGTSAAAAQVSRNFKARGTYTTTRQLQPIAGPGLVLDSRNVESYLDNVRLRFAPADSGATPFIEEEFEARGHTQDAARLTAQQSVNYNISQQDSTLTLDQGLTLRENAPYRSQRLTLTLHLPLDKVYRLTPLFQEHLDDEDFTGGSSPDGNQEHRVRFTRQGKFTCLDCPPASSSDDGDDDEDDEVVNVDVAGTKAQVRVNTDGDEPTVHISTSAPNFNTDPGHYGTSRKTMSTGNEFSEVEVSGAFQVLVRQGDSFKAEAAGRPGDLDDVRLEVRGDRLVVRSRRNNGLFSAFGSRRNPILVQVTLPRLRRLELSAACQADVSGFRDEDLRLEASSAASARLDVHVPRLELQLSSAAHAELSGTAAELAVDGSSASTLDALDLRATKASIDLSSGSEAKVRATDELKVDLSSGSQVRYAGRPSHIEKDLSSGSSLEEVRE